MTPRPSPSYSATPFPVGTKRKGGDGNMYVVTQTKAGVRRWTRFHGKSVAHSATKCAQRVYIMDNGAVPFMVELSTNARARPGVARVFRERKGHDERLDHRVASDKDDFYEAWRDFEYVSAWVGADPSERSKPHTSPHHTSLLLQLPAVEGQAGRCRLVVVGMEIYRFALPKGETVVDFVSVMGNSGVPYPYVVGSWNTYLTLEKVYLPNELVPHGQDPYHVYYNGLDKNRAFASTHRTHGIRVLHGRHKPW